MQLVKPSYEILTPIDGTKMLCSIEAAGRTCYKSEGKITDDSAMEFCRKILKRGHHSVIEHESVSVRFVIDRGVSHELVWHRLCAFSQESTRYCNYGGGVTFVIPPWVDIEPGEYFGGVDMAPDEPDDFAALGWFSAMLDAEDRYLDLLKHGWNPQQARSVLPNSLNTEIVVTANLREWRHIFSLRTSSAAHPQMQEIMIPLLEEFRQRIPVLFKDLTP